MKYIIFITIIIIVILLFLSRTFPPAQTNPSSSPTSAESPSQSSTALSKGEVPSFLKLPSGYVAHIFASNLGTARDLQFTQREGSLSPGGTLLVSNPGSSEVYALPDKNNDGKADSKKVILKDGSKAHGIAFFNGKLYVAEVNKVVRFNWDENNLSASLDKVLFSLPENGNHNLRTITFNKDGKMFVSVGSTCNICNESSNLSATVITADADGNNMKVFAKGLRNAPFIQINPSSGELWGTEMGRDNLGDNIPPDEIDIIKDGGDFGWPNCYGDRVHDGNFDVDNQVDCAKTIPPIFEIPAHSAPLGLTFISSSQFPSDWQGDLLVSYHGSWNRSMPTGYKVVHLKVKDNTITSAEDFITGFLPSGALVGPAQASGRPVDLTFDSKGNLYLSDDKNGNVYIIQKQ